MKEVDTKELKIENLLTEQDMMELLGLKKEQLLHLVREEGLPAIRISTRRKLFLESDVIEWAVQRRYIHQVTRKTKIIGQNGILIESD